MQSTVTSVGSGNAGSGPAKKENVVVQKPPRIELENFKNWAVEYHKNNRNITIEIADMKQTVYIFKCENSVVQIKGKVNSITIDGCKKTSVAFDSLLGQIEIINSQSIEVQTLGTMPTVSIQKTDGCQVYLSKESLQAEIVTSKSSEMNILVPKDDGDYVSFYWIKCCIDGSCFRPNSRFQSNSKQRSIRGRTSWKQLCQTLFEDYLNSPCLIDAL